MHKKINIANKKRLFSTSVGCLLILLFLVFCTLDDHDIKVENNSANVRDGTTIEEQLNAKPLETNIVPNPTGQASDNDQKAAAKTPPAKEATLDDQQQSTKVAYVTFDDGPSYTSERLLDILDDYHAKATFFMLEPRMKAFPNSVTRIVEGGHAAALHGVSHRWQEFYQSTETVLNEANTAQATLLAITGYKSTLIRTPYGSSPHLKPEHKEVLKQAGYQYWDWNVDSRDWYFRDQRMVTNTIEQINKLAEHNVAPVILLHDRAETVEFLPQILDYLVNNDYKLDKLDADMEPVVFGT